MAGFLLNLETGDHAARQDIEYIKARAVRLEAAKSDDSCHSFDGEHITPEGTVELR